MVVSAMEYQSRIVVLRKDRTSGPLNLSKDKINWSDAHVHFAYAHAPHLSYDNCSGPRGDGF